MLTAGVISGDVRPIAKTKLDPLVNQKVSSITKSVVSFYSFPVSLRGAFAPKELPALKNGAKMKSNNKSAS